LDIPRAAPKKRSRFIYAGIGVGALALVSWGVSRLGPAAPTVDRALVLVDSVRYGTLVREVRAPGTLVPENIRFVPAITAGRVERKLVQPGTRVEATTVLLELSNPDVQLELLEAERQLSAAQSGLVTLRTSLETQRLAQEGVVANTRTLYLEAERNARVAQELVKKNLVSESEAEGAKERAEEYRTRMALEEKGLEVLKASIEPQLQVQEGQVKSLTAIVAFQRERIASMRVVAGTDGVLQDMALEEGQYVLPGQTLARVVKPERLKAVLRVPQVQARDVVIGQKVMIDTRRDTIPGRIARIDPAVENASVAMDVALEGDLPLGARPDLSVDGTIEIERLENVLYVGRPAFGQAETTVGLFRMVKGSDYAERVTIRLGRSSVNTIQVVDGLAEGDVVILNDMSQWDRFDRVKIK